MGRILAGMAGMALLASGAAAQKLTVTDGVLQVGQEISVSYCDPHRRGEVVDVTVCDGDPDNPQVVTIHIYLDAAGCGHASWTVPSWVTAAFNAPGAEEVMTFIAVE